MRCAMPACSRGSRPPASRSSITATPPAVALAARSRAAVRPESRGRRGLRDRDGRARARGARSRRARAGAGRRLHGRSRHGGRASAGRRAPRGSSTSTCTATSTRPTASRTARSTGWESRTCSARRTRRPSCATSGRTRRCSPTTRSCSSRIAAIRARRASSRRSSAAGSTTVPSSAVADDPAAAAGEALAALESCERLAVHFDVDCIDFTDAPLSENTGRNIGLTQDAAFAALAAVLLDSRVSALTITRAEPRSRRGGRLDARRLRRPAGRSARRRGGAALLKRVLRRPARAWAVARGRCREPGSGGSGRLGSRVAAVGRLVADVHEALTRMGQGADERGHAATHIAPRSHDLAARAGQDGVDLAIDHDVPSHAHASICSR